MQEDNSARPAQPESLAAADPASAADTPSSPSSESATTVMPSTEELLKAAELKAAEHHDAWLRAKAETENVRRRAQDDIAKAGKFAVEKFSGELLAVKDSLEAALANENQTAEGLKSGVELTLRQLVSAFEKSGLTEINPLGTKFDPTANKRTARARRPILPTSPTP